MSGDRSAKGKIRPIYAHRRMKAIAARWDARVDSWDHALEDPTCHLNADNAYGRFTRVVQGLIAKREKFCASHGIIDAGCGTGLVLAELKSAFAWAIGIDISPRMIRAARAKRLTRTKFLVGDCFELPSLCPMAGAIVSRGVLLSHYGRKQGEAMLHAARTSLALGGFLVFDFLNETARTKFGRAPENKNWFTGEEVELMARRAGFSIVTILGKPNRRALLLLAETSTSPVE
jgi:predicted TPR repeat methyltransferase